MGRVRWCKGNHTGLRSVISEWICARLARQLGLPVPDFSIMKLDLELFTDWRRDRGTVPEIVTESNQYVFASLNVEDCKDVLRPSSELAHIDGTFIDEVWSEMPEEWTDAGSVVLPLSSIRKSLEESTHVGNVL